jgi:hypothetical protein
MNNSSLVANSSVYDNSPYEKLKIEPDTVAYSSQFYAKNHIPSLQERPGNNTIATSIYEKYRPEYNLYCYK